MQLNDLPPQAIGLAIYIELQVGKSILKRTVLTFERSELVGVTIHETDMNLETFLKFEGVTTI